MKLNNSTGAVSPEGDTDVQRRNRKAYLFFATCLTANSAICGESLLVLIAIRFGFGDTFCTLIGSFLYLGYLVLPSGYYFAARCGVVKSIAMQTMVSVLGSLLTLLAALIFPFSARTAQYMLTVGTMIFFAAKSSGSAMLLPLQANISNEHNRPHMLGKIAVCSNVAALMSTVVIALAMHFFKSSRTYPVLLGGGALLGTVSALSLMWLREPPILRTIAGYPVFRQIVLAWHEPLIRKQLLLGCCLNMSLVMLVPVEMLAVKHGMGFADAKVTAMWAVKVAASIAGAALWSFLARRYGSSKVCTYAVMLIPLLCLFWLLTPFPLMANIAFLPFLVSGVMIVFYSNSLLDFFMKSVSAPKQQGGSLLIMVITGGIAGLLGFVLNALIFWGIEKLLLLQENSLEFYRTYFTVAGLLFLFPLCCPGFHKAMREFR